MGQIPRSTERILVTIIFNSDINAIEVDFLTATLKICRL